MYGGTDTAGQSRRLTSGGEAVAALNILLRQASPPQQLSLALAQLLVSEHFFPSTGASATRLKCKENSFLVAPLNFPLSFSGSTFSRHQQTRNSRRLQTIIRFAFPLLPIFGAMIALVLITRSSDFCVFNAGLRGLDSYNRRAPQFLSIVRGPLPISNAVLSQETF